LYGRGFTSQTLKSAIQTRRALIFFPGKDEHRSECRDVLEPGSGTTQLRRECPPDEPDGCPLAEAEGREENVFLVFPLDILRAKSVIE
jgi:hypothetical protein